MITCNVLGPSKIDGLHLAGLGNQMFTIATTIALALDNNDEAIFPDLKDKQWYGSYTENIFRNLEIKGNKSFVKNLYSQPGWKFSKIPYAKDMCLNGYFQSEKFFQHRREELLKIFEMPSSIRNYILNKYESIFSMKNLVGVHVRRNDFLTPRLSQFHHSQTIDYYYKAMSLFENNSNFIFFSDDISWCKENFDYKNNTYFIEGETDVIDLYFMSMMEHNIIANSTFSWWGAWLNDNPDKIVIVPKKWYGPKNSHLEDNDIVPDSWRII
jgi:hypothetical protein